MCNVHGPRPVWLPRVFGLDLSSVFVVAEGLSGFAWNNRAEKRSFFGLF